MHDLEAVHRDLVRQIATHFAEMSVSLEHDDDDNSLLDRFRRERHHFAQLVNIGRRLDCLEGVVVAHHMIQDGERLATFVGAPNDEMREGLARDGFTFVEASTLATLAAVDEEIAHSRY